MAASQRAVCVASDCASSLATASRTRAAALPACRQFNTSARQCNTPAKPANRPLFPNSRAAFSSSSSSLAPSPRKTSPLPKLPEYPEYPALQQHPVTHGHHVATLTFTAFSTCGPGEEFANMMFFIDFAMRAAYALGIPVTKPASLPTRKSLWTVLKSPFVHKKSMENFERRISKRVIKVYDANEAVVDRWLYYLRAHAMPDVTMRAEVFCHRPIGIGRMTLEAAEATFGTGKGMPKRLGSAGPQSSTPPTRRVQAPEATAAEEASAAAGAGAGAGAGAQVQTAEQASKGRPEESSPSPSPSSEQQRKQEAAVEAGQRAKEAQRQPEPATLDQADASAEDPLPLQPKPKVPVEGQQPQGGGEKASSSSSSSSS